MKIIICISRRYCDLTALVSSDTQLLFIDDCHMFLVWLDFLVLYHAFSFMFLMCIRTFLVFGEWLCLCDFIDHHGCIYFCLFFDDSLVKKRKLGAYVCFFIYKVCSMNSTWGGDFRFPHRIWQSHFSLLGSKLNCIVFGFLDAILLTALILCLVIPFGLYTALILPVPLQIMYITILCVCTRTLIKS